MAVQQPGSGRRPGSRPRTVPNPIPTLLVGVGLAWLGFDTRRKTRRAPAMAGQATDSAPGVAGGSAQTPTQIPARGWKEVLLRVKDEITNDNMGIIAAGCAFYALLALFPAITAMVSIYGLVADPAQVEQDMQSLAGVVPAEAFTIIRDQTHAVASGGDTALGWAAALAIVLALYSASSGVKSLFEALNIAYEEDETRGFIRYNLTALLFTLAAVVGVAIVLTVIVGVPIVLGYLPLGPLAEWAARIVSWLLLLAVVAAGIAMTYRFGPSRAPADWRWVSPGSIAATLLWVVASLAFSYYAANFAGYNETYGALGGVIVLLMWLWLSAYVLLLGAELNAELELQTATDTTTGPNRPEGERGAYVADHVPQHRDADPAKA